VPYLPVTLMHTPYSVVDGHADGGWVVHDDGSFLPAISEDPHSSRQSSESLAPV